MKLFITIVSIMLSTYNCKKPCEPAPIAFPQNFLDFFGKIHPNNYWIYKGTNNEIDSVYATEIMLNDINAPKLDCGLTIIQSTYKLNTSYIIPNQNSVYYSNEYANNEGGAPFCMCSKTKYGNNGTTVFQIDNIDSIPLITKNLNGVIYTECVEIISFFLTNYKFYYKRNIGLVGWQNGLGTFNLIRYSVN